MCHLVARGLHKVAAPYFLLFMYMVQLYKEDWDNLAYVGLSGLLLRAIVPTV